MSRKKNEDEIKKIEAGFVPPLPRRLKTQAPKSSISKTANETKKKPCLYTGEHRINVVGDTVYYIPPPRASCVLCPRQKTCASNCQIKILKDCIRPSPLSRAITQAPNSPIWSTSNDPNNQTFAGDYDMEEDIRPPPPSRAITQAPNSPIWSTSNEPNNQTVAREHRIDMVEGAIVPPRAFRDRTRASTSLDYTSTRCDWICIFIILIIGMAIGIVILHLTTISFNEEETPDPNDDNM